MDDAYTDAVRRTIKVELTARDWDRHDLADRSGLTYVTIGRILRGERDLTMPYLVSLAGAFGWTAGELLLKAESRLRERGHDVPGNPGVHPDDAAIVDSSDKLTKRQRAQVKRSLSGEHGEPGHHHPNDGHAKSS
jgi:transcriptional regulator with XRE-family HTH domain